MRPKRSSRLSTGTTSSYRSSKTPSLLNGSGEGKFISSGDARDDASPGHSRSSSAQGSCSTSATTFEDAEDAGKAPKPKEIKGNVIVSVRVRPDNNSGGETPRNHGEWSVDSRQSLISYRGKEGGDYCYGMNTTLVNSQSRELTSQIMSLIPKKTTPKFTIPPPSAWSAV
jgi:centromeric protein E